ncbi:2-oxo acid dehydrogenase subunit E2 [Magnetospirillum molischianum]|uniref:Dihydrolipoyllysine-residue acetyltransferase component of pyruvate dehydrogenase complex (E2) (Dihydrolipoamide acetyltransferase component of pyruvate dehydrogenase complex) n=1 Tax=Magnetospirillum molischianum DSM 120 TaxID=1150626 RepID=H8FPG7_MAGML
MSSEPRQFASPLARRLAAAAGIDLTKLTGSGPHGRIVKADVEKAKTATPPPHPAPIAASPTLPAPAAPAASAGYTDLPLTPMRRTIARRLTEAKATIPHFYLTVDIEMDAVLALREQLNARLAPDKLSVNDFILRAVALGLRAVPEANAAWAETAIRRFTDIDIAVAVATPEGLITPIVRQADRKGLGEISAEVKSLATRARDGALKPEEYQGGGFTISNLGMYGVRDFAAIINPPQACILAVGSADPRPIVKAGALAVATVMSVTLSVDHRTVDGATAARFLATTKSMLEDPLRMML